MKSIIIFNFDRKVIYIIIHCLSYILSKFLKPSFHGDIITDICLLISFIINLLLLILRAKNTDSSNQNSNISQKLNFKEYYYILFIYLLYNIIVLLIEIKNSIINYCYSNIIFFGILFITFLRNEQLFIHQKISVIILFFCIFFTSNFFNLFNQSKSHIIFTSIYSSLYYYSEGLIRGYFKYSMEVNFINPFFISSVDAFINLLKNIFERIYKYYILNQQINYFSIAVDKEIKYIQSILRYTFLVLMPTLNILICYYYTPYHLYSSLILAHFIIKNLVTLNDIIVGIINIFFSLIISEVIILKFCDLNYNTKLEIKNRACKAFLPDLMDSAFDSEIEINEN